MTVPVDPTPLAKKRRYLTAYALGLFLLIGLSYGIYWVLWGRFYEKTDDAYVNGNMITLTPQVDGIITSIWADNAQKVKEGQLIVQLDPHDYQIAFEQKKAQLGESVRFVARLFTKVQELEAALEVKKAALVRANLDFMHRKVLVEDASVSKEDFEHSETSLYGAFASVLETEKELEAAYQEVQGTDLLTHPLVLLSKEGVKQAYLNLHRCNILSPAEGIVTLRKAEVGTKVSAMSPLLSIVPLDQIWVDANFREVQLKDFRIGQPVVLTSDMYGRGVKFHGKLIGMNPGTGSVFSILPPQNATGNWIKIIQRIPVKISLSLKECREHPLLLGLSMYATVDIHDKMGKQLPAAIPEKPIYATNIYENELEGIDAVIEEIIIQNSTDGND